MEKTSKKRANKGAGSIYQDTKTGKWHCYETIGYINGERVRPNITCASKTEAQQKLNEIKANKDSLFEAYKIKKGLIQVEEIKAPTLHNSLDEFIQTYKKPLVSSCTNAGYKDEIKRIKGYFSSDTLIKDVTTKMVQEFLNSLAVRYSKETIRKTKRMLNWVLEKAMLEGEINQNPINIFVKLPLAKDEQHDTESRIGYESIDTYTDEELINILIAFEENDIYKPIIHFLIETGCRIQEVLAIKLKDIDRQNSTITICRALKMIENETDPTQPRFQWYSGTTKNKQGRILNISPNLIKVLDEWITRVFNEKRGNGKYKYEKIRNTFIREGEEAPLFCNNEGKQRTINGLSSIFRNKFSKNETLQGIHFKFHKFRHTRATIMGEADKMDELKAGNCQRFMGHTSLNTTLRYYVSNRVDEKKTKCSSSREWYDYLNCEKLEIINGKVR